MCSSLIFSHLSHLRNISSHLYLMYISSLILYINKLIYIYIICIMIHHYYGGFIIPLSFLRRHGHGRRFLRCGWVRSLGSSRLHLGTGTLWELLAFLGTGNEITGPTGPTGPTEPGIRMGNLVILLEICQKQLFVSR